MRAGQQGTRAIIAFLGTVLMGCGSDAGIDRTAVTEDVGATPQWIELGDGAGVELEAGLRMCGKWERKTAGGTETHPEYYSYERLNAQLADNARLREKVAELGITQVDSCKSARTVSHVRSELWKTTPPAKAADQNSDALVAPNSVVAGTEPGLNEAREEGLVQEGDEGRVDKIGSGIAEGHKPTVQLGIWFGAGFTKCMSCSGTLIGPNQILTSAHCAVVDNARPISVMHSTFVPFVGERIGTCLHGVCGSTPNAICNTRPANTTGRTHFYPHYSGTGDWAENMGVIVMHNNHPVPANTSTSWIRIHLQGLYFDSWIRGWGVSGESGAGAGVLRRSTHNVGYCGGFWMANQQKWDWRFCAQMVGEQALGTACIGDGGGPRITTTWAPTIDLDELLVAVSAGFTNSGPPAACPRVDDHFYYTATSEKKDWIKEKAGGCSTYEFANIPGAYYNYVKYMRCW